MSWRRWRRIRNQDDPFREYPELEPDDLTQALAFAATSLDVKMVELSPLV
ncbi:MAG: hypothetical protein KDA86_17600 [Planctomycetaceae bacterium]|nr:hypothetical protein [Planctomycetaceae bacterium]